MTSDESALAHTAATGLNQDMIEQAIYGSHDAGGYRFVARSAGFREEWLSEAEQVCTGFGERPAGIACPQAVFALPFAHHYVAIVQVADQGNDDTGRPGALGFYLLVLPCSFYRDQGGDPFFIAEQFLPPWEARGELPTLTLTAEAPPRTVAMLQKTLNVSYSATLLGGVQILLDGGRLVFERSSPDEAILRSLWALLPSRERAELWPASFVFSNAHQFDAVVVPRAAGPAFEPYITEDKAGDYPEGRYECNLQSAIETGDQGEVDALLHYSRSRLLRLIVFLAVVVAVLALAMNRLLPPATQPVSSHATNGQGQPALDIPPVDRCPTLSVRERTELAEHLQALGKRWKVDLPQGSSDADLTAALEALDRVMGTPEGRDPGPLRSYGPIQRQLRVLLWKHRIASYNTRGLNTVELLERLEQMEKVRDQ